MNQSLDLGMMSTTGFQSEKWLEYIFTGDYFSKENPWTESTSPLTTPGSIHHGPSVDGRPELAGAWPPAAPVLKGTSQGAEDGETGSGSR
jgi:hypothetical protein